MHLSLSVRELVIASWPVRREEIARAVYPGLEPAEVDGRFLVSVAALRFGGGRAGPIPAPPFAQVNVRTYVGLDGEPAVYFLRSYVTPGGLGGLLIGAPFRPARIAFRPGRIDAEAAGFSLPYELGDRADAGELAAHELGVYEAAGLRAFRIHRGSADWFSARPAGPVRADALLALGFELTGGPSLVYARDASFEAEVPPKAVTSPRSAAGRVGGR